jgi:hypothetical protein
MFLRRNNVIRFCALWLCLWCAGNSFAQDVPSGEQLQQLLAPIALYPDPLLAQITAASADPQQIVDADAWLKQNRNLQGQALTDAAQKQGFDPAFISLVTFPTVLDAMARNIDDYAAIGGHFDADEGAQELAYRRIGQNELDAIRVVRALYAAQKTYAASGHDGNPAGLYAQRFRSQPGTEEGLYWEAKEGEGESRESPAGAFIAEATGEGYETGRRRTPFHGYYYRILKGQGAHASGGAKDYVQDGKMTAGFAIIAYPAEYRSSGIMSFLIGPKGKLFEKDLGETSEDAMKAMVFDPDSSWHVVH